MKVNQPDLHGVSLKDIDLLNENELANAQITDAKGRYLYWDKIKHKYGMKKAKIMWLLIKQKRQSIQKHITLADGYVFSFCVPDTMQALLHFIDKTCVNYAIRDISQSDRYTLRLEEAIMSAIMEGAATTRENAQELLTKRPQKPRNDYEKMIVNNYQLMQKVLALKNEPLSIDLILDLHRITTNEVIENNAISGEFRQSDDIFISDADNNRVYQPPKFTHVPELMANLCNFANQEHDGIAHSLFIHPVVKAIMLHFFIGYIHPFGDGNGRTARALFYWFMMKQGYDLFEYISISRLLHQAPIGYGKSYLYTEYDDLDMTYFIYYQLDKIKYAIDDLQAYVKRETEKLHHFYAENENFAIKYQLDTREIELLKIAMEHKGKTFSAKEVANQFNISENTARKHLKNLASLQLLAQMKSGNGVVFISPADLRERLNKG